MASPSITSRAPNFHLSFLFISLCLSVPPYILPTEAVSNDNHRALSAPEYVQYRLRYPDFIWTAQHGLQLHIYGRTESSALVGVRFSDPGSISGGSPRCLGLRRHRAPPRSTSTAFCRAKRCNTTSPKLCSSSALRAQASSEKKTCSKIIVNETPFYPFTVKLSYLIR